MKKYIVLFVVALVAVVLIQCEQIKKINAKYENAMTNVKAYEEELTGEKQNNRAYALTIEQLKAYKDSIILRLRETQKELEIKNKNLQALHYISSGFTKSDTIYLKDTLFKDPYLKVDTLIGDDWYNVKVGLEYPSKIAVTPTFKSEKHIIVSSKKETINPPKKIFFLRWFQKKHRVVQIDVVEKNPYVTDEYSKYIEIIK